MPYQTNSELPKGVQNKLPHHAQDIYREAFNHAWQQYADPEKRRDDKTREETAHSVAWSAVEKKYHKNSSGDWVKQGA